MVKKTQTHVVIGLGVTGLSCVRFLRRQGLPVIVMDTRECPPSLEPFRQTYPDIPVFTGASWPQEQLNHAKTIIVSPGVSTQIAPLVEAAKHTEIIGDIELFARHNQTPIIGVTGANGKSTVVSLVAAMAKAAGKRVALIGNIGTPVLDLFDQEKVELIVMELSSFQLETTMRLPLLAATVLNITPDHMDRYPTLGDYIKAKHRIYHHTQQAIINKQDPLSESIEIPPSATRTFFTLEPPLPGEFGICQREGQPWLAYGEELLMPASALKLMGKHNLANALSALALGTAAGLDRNAMIAALESFTGLSHRCQWVSEYNQIKWINDSKGTNVGATIAALAGIGADLKGKIVLLLGGDGKEADFSGLIPAVHRYCRAVVVMGKDGPRLLATLKEVVSTYEAADMKQAVSLAQSCALPGDVVLLSPACASTDQYRDYTQRGERFMDAVKGLGTDYADFR